MTQQQFLHVIDRDEAQRRFHEVLQLTPLGKEEVPLEEALGRTLAEDVIAPVNVPSFDRSNYDGYAVRAEDTYGATEQEPVELELLSESIPPGVKPKAEIGPGQAMAIATGAMLPRGADAVVMVEHTDEDGQKLIVYRAVTPGFGVTFAGTDIAAGETVLRRGQVLSSRQMGVLAAVGVSRVAVWQQPRVAIISTGNELISPGAPMQPGLVYDSNARIIADAVRELGGKPLVGGIVPDDLEQLCQRLRQMLNAADVVLLSGGTSKGGGDLSYEAVRRVCRPGIIVHGVALKPGKPICLAAHEGKPVVILPGFPTSAIFTFHEFVAPLLRKLSGRPETSPTTVEAKLAVKVNSEIGRREYLLVNLVPSENYLAAYPLGKGSGSVTTFSHADGFIAIGEREEIVEAGTQLCVQLIGDRLQVADLVVIGSHCVGLDWLLGRMQELGFQTKFIAVGSMAGLEAAKRQECDLAGIHLMDPDSGRYNTPFLTEQLDLIPGYRRLQGIVYRPGDGRFDGRSAEQAVQAAIQDPRCIMVNRNQGSGTRILIDRLLQGAQPPGYAVQVKSHTAVAAAVAQGRADWGVAVKWVADKMQLGFIPLTDEEYDFVVPKSRANRPAVRAFQKLLLEPATQEHLRSMGFEPKQQTKR